MKFSGMGWRIDAREGNGEGGWIWGSVKEKEGEGEWKRKGRKLVGNIVQGEIVIGSEED